MSQIYRVFLSSTGKDLADYRQKVFEALQRKADVKVVRMEDFVAADRAPTHTCTREVQESHILIGLIGFCYGSSAPRRKTSFTERGYNNATKARLPGVMVLAPASWGGPGNGGGGGCLCAGGGAGGRVRRPWRTAHR